MLVINGEYLIHPIVLFKIIRYLIQMVGAKNADEVIRFAKLFDSLIHEGSVLCPESDRTPRVRSGDADVIFGMYHIDKITMAFKPSDAAIQDR